MIKARWYWIGLFGSLALLGIAYFYFQLQLGLAPCPLCLFQRACLVGVAILCLFGLILNPSKVGSKLIAIGIALMSLLGVSIAGRQVWLQHLPADQVPECGPDLAFMLESFPLMEVVQTVLTGSGSCAQVQWQFIGLSMPEWMLGIFIVMSYTALKLLFTKERQYFSGELGR